MGQCYTTYLKVRFNDEDGAKKELRNKISRGREEHIGYDVEGLVAKHGYDLDNMSDLLSVFFSGWGTRLKRDYRDTDIRVADFNASYGWEDVMIETFSIIAPFMEDGSWMKIYPDSDYDHLVVKGGKAVLIH